MARIAFLECARCGNRLAAGTRHALCPRDDGSLYLRYDTEALRRSSRREHPAEIAAAPGPSLGIWRYADVLPDVKPVTLGEGWTPMIQSRRYAGLLVKDEGANPTGSLEARGFALAVTMARHYGLKQLAIASRGSAAKTLAAYAATAGIPVHVFAPKTISLEDYVECVLYRAEVTLVHESVTGCARMLGERIKQQETSGVTPNEIWIDLSSETNPFRVEGQKTMGYELVEQLGWRYPDALLCPIEAGLAALWKAFEEMEQLGWVNGKRPKVYGIQPAVAPGIPESNVDDICTQIVRESGGKLMASEDAEILASLPNWAAGEGLFLSLEGAAAAAAYDNLLASGELTPRDRVVLISKNAGSEATAAIAAAMHLRHPGAFPTSLPVGGIITPV